MVDCRLKKGSPANYFIIEAVQCWMNKEGKTETLSLLRGMSIFYYDAWIYGSSLELRKRNVHLDRIYDICPAVIYPRMKVIPELTRNGFKGAFYDICLYCTPKVRHKTFGVFFMKYSYEQRLIIVSRVKQGELIAHLSKEYHINKTQILAWVRMWDKYGPSGLEQQPHCRPTVKLKEEVVRLILEKGVPLSHVRIEYRIGKTALQRWVSTVRKYGYEALAPSKRQGRALKEPMGRPKKKEPQTELERLQAENLRLRAENALLKKAKALVEAKKAQALLNGREPSTN